MLFIIKCEVQSCKIKLLINWKLNLLNWILLYLWMLKGKSINEFCQFVYFVFDAY